MPVMEIKYKASFTAKDAQGNLRRLTEWVAIWCPPATQSQHPKPESPLTRIMTERGEDVRLIAKGKYQVVETGEILTLKKSRPI